MSYTINPDGSVTRNPSFSGSGPRKPYQNPKNNRNSSSLLGLLISLIIIGSLFLAGTMFIYLTKEKTEVVSTQPSESTPRTTENPNAQIETSTSQPTKEITPTDVFHDKVRNCQWYSHSSGDFSFSYPDFMKYTTYFVEEAPGSVEVFSWENVELAYWPLLGYWAVDFAEKGTFVTKSATISNVTYKAISKGIYSGYTSDGRIYYLKTKVLEGGEVPHATVLALIYPQEFKACMDELTKIVLRW
jgi:hypothetical protein